MIKTLAERMIESDAQTLVSLVDFSQAGRQKTVPQGDIRGLPVVQCRRLGQRRGANIWMGGCQGRASGSSSTAASFITQLSQLVREVPPTDSWLAATAWPPSSASWDRQPPARPQNSEPRLPGDFPLLLGNLLLQGRQSLPANVVILDQSVDQLVESAQFGNGVLLQCADSSTKCL